MCEDRIGTMMSPSKQCAMCHRFTCTRCIVKKRVLSNLVDFTAVCRENFCKKCLRYVSDVNLRDPQSLRDVWQFATSSMSAFAEAGVTSSAELELTRALSLFLQTTRRSVRTRASTRRTAAQTRAARQTTAAMLVALRASSAWRAPWTATAATGRSATCRRRP